MKKLSSFRNLRAVKLSPEDMKYSSSGGVFILTAIAAGVVAKRTLDLFENPHKHAKE